MADQAPPEPAEIRVAFQGDHGAAIGLAIRDGSARLAVGWVDSDTDPTEVQLSTRDLDWLVELTARIRHELHFDQIESEQA